MFQLVLKASSAAVALCALCSGVATAQNSNGVPIIKHRVYHYSGYAQPLGGAAANLPPAPPSNEEIFVPGQDDIKVTEELQKKNLSAEAMAPNRRVDSRREKDKDKEQAKSLFVMDNTATNKVDPEIKKWGWLAEEADANRQVLESYRKPKPEDEAYTNGLAGQAETNAAKRMQIGSLKANAYEPVNGGSSATTANVERVVQDRVAREAEKRKQDDAKQKVAQKDGMNMSEKRDLPPVMTATNETLGLARSHKDDERTDATLETDFSQTRKAMAEISNRYQLNLTMADLIRRPTAPTPDPNAGKTLASRNAADREGMPGIGGGDAQRPTTTGGDTGGNMTSSARASGSPASSMSGSGTAWMKASSVSLPPAKSATAMVEGPKAVKASDMQAAAMLAPSTPPPSAPATYVPQPSYAPASTLPSYYTPGGGHSSGTITPAFKPTAPYKSLFDTPSTR